MNEIRWLIRKDKMEFDEVHILLEAILIIFGHSNTFLVFFFHIY